MRANLLMRGLALFAAVGASGCHEGGWTQWTGSGATGHWYKIDATRTDWESASASATANSRYLATITSAGEEQFVISTFLKGDHAKQVFWLGATDKVVEDTWRWVTGEPFSYTNWKSLEPSGGSENYLCINWNAVRNDPVGEWNDAPNAGTTGYDSGANDGPYASLLESNDEP